MSGCGLSPAPRLDMVFHIELEGEASVEANNAKGAVGLSLFQFASDGGGQRLSQWRGPGGPEPCARRERYIQ